MASEPDGPYARNGLPISGGTASESRAGKFVLPEKRAAKVFSPKTPTDCALPKKRQQGFLAGKLHRQIAFAGKKRRS